MYGIYYKEGIYVAIDNNQENDLCVFHTNNNHNGTLYGGRIRIISLYRNGGSANLTIDGVKILRFEHIRFGEGSTKTELKEDLSIVTIASHLNAIEANGVDTFNQNYKQSIEFLYSELKDFRQKTEMQLSSEQNDSEIKSVLTELEIIRSLLFSVLAILFSLQTYMTAGLENEKVKSVCQSIMDSFS